MRDTQAEGSKLTLLNKYRRCILRIQFPSPDCLVLQGTFLITETISDVVNFVRKYLQVSDKFYVSIHCAVSRRRQSKFRCPPHTNVFFFQEEHLSFHLFTAPPKNILDVNKTLLDEGCVPTALIHFAADQPVSNYESKVGVFHIYQFQILSPIFSVN